MQQSSSHIIKPFSCPFHPSEEIQRVCLDLSSEHSLQCIECILQTRRKMPKDKFCHIADFVSFAAEQYKNGEGSQSFCEPPPSSLVDFLAYEESKIKALSEKIEKEKHGVQENFNKLLEEFTLLFHNKKEEILNKLDMQLVLLKNNYAIYKSKIDKYYISEKQEFDQDSLVQRINHCKDTQEMELLVRDVKEDVLKSSDTDYSQSKAEEIKADLRNFVQELTRESNTIPKSSFSDISLMQKVIQETKKRMEELSEIQDPVTDIFGRNLSYDSKIITNIQDAGLIRKWLRLSARNTEPRLLYRGSRDGFDAATFHKKCDSSEATLTIAKSTSGYILGGFSDQSWQGNSTYKSSNHCWLFSINHRERYLIKKTCNTQAIFASSTDGPTFGTGHDLFLNLQSTSSTGCYSKLGQAYEYDPKDPSEKQTRLGGSFQFVLEEIEVFAVYGKYSRTITSKNLDSLILDIDKDLQLLQTWSSKLRNIDLELLYRGSRDGFDAQAFHAYCDDQGSNLVVCKAAGSGKVFGGYTSQSWAKSNKFVFDTEAFLFSITESTKHAIKDRDYAICCSGKAGPVFGKGYDLFIGENSHENNECMSALGKTYKVNEKVGDLAKYLAGEVRFNLEEIEVFKITNNFARHLSQKLFNSK